MLTVLIPCKDERHNILDCIDSVREIADEILVADSGSTDGTLELVKDLPGVRVIEREYVNSADFKNWAIPQATHEWVLLVDADERVTSDVAMSARKAIAEPGDNQAFAVRRDTYMLGHRLRYSGAQSATCTRLFRRHLRYQPRRVHADIVVEPAIVTDDTKVVTVGVSVPLDARNGYVTPRFFVGEHVWKITTIPREAKNDANMDSLISSEFEKVKDKLEAKADASDKGNDKAKGKGKGKDKAKGKAKGKGKGKDS